MDEPDLAYLDANVLVPSIIRGMFVIGQQYSPFAITWSALSEQEAEHHQKAGAAPISQLRTRFGWRDPVETVERGSSTDTDPKDVPHLLSAVAGGARYIITANVRDFGSRDLIDAGVAAVEPDFFLAARMPAAAYEQVLSALAAGRRRHPKTTDDIHASEVADKLPRLAHQHRSLLSTTPTHASRRGPRTTFCGAICVRCGKPLSADLEGSRHVVGLHSWCREALGWP